MAKTIVTNAVLKINGKEVENSFYKVNGAVKKLSTDLNKLEIGTKEWIDKAAELKKAKAHFESIKSEINAVTNTLEKSSGILGFFQRNIISLGDTFRQVFTANLAERFLDTIISKGTKTVDELLKIADAMTDVEKTSGMTHDQVKELWDQFDQMDTRTSKLDRLKIAEVGGKLGVPIEQMKDFVQQMDKMYVALGDAFEGGLEGMVDQLGKIKGLFDTTKEMSYAEAINRVGSALNTLAAQGTASEGNIAQFALRVGTLPDALKPAIDKVLGLGAAFEEAGIDQQIAASGLTNFLTTAGENISAFAYSMHMSKKEAEDLLNTNPEEFFLKFAEGMKGLSGTQTAKVLESLKLNSLEVQKAIGAAANKTDDFRKSMKTAGVEIDKMTSATDEFNKKNNNAPAIIDKLKNAWNDTFTSTNIINKFEWLIQAIGWLTGVTREASDGVVVFKERLVFLGKIITVLVASVLGYNAALLVLTLTTKSAYQQTLLYNVVQKAKVAWDTIARGTTLLYAAAKAILTGNVVRATAAMRLFNITTKLNPLGLIIGVITAAIVAYSLFSKKVDETTSALKRQKKEQDTLKKVSEQAAENAAGEISLLDRLYKKATDVNSSMKDRIAAVKQLKTEFPDYFGKINDEIILNGKAKDSYEKLRDAIISAARAEAAKEELKNREAQRLKRDEKLQRELDVINKQFPNLKYAPKLDTNNPEAGRVLTPKELEMAKALMKKTQLENYKLLNKMSDEEADKFLTDFIYNNEKKSPSNNKGKTNISAPEKTPKNREAEQSNNDLERAKSEYAKALEESAKNKKQLLEIQQKYYDESYKIVDESLQKELDLENQDFINKQASIKQENDARLAANKTLQIEIEKLEKDSADTKNLQAKEYFQKAIIEKKAQQNQNISLNVENNKLEAQYLETSLFNLRKIREKWNAKKFEDDTKFTQRQIDNRRRDREQEITNISSLEQAKEKLRNQSYLKLTDDELSAIDNLEDAKAALREVYDREMLANQEKAISLQIAQLNEALNDPSLSEEARQKLAEYLDFLKDKAVQIQSAIKGGEDADNKKVTEENKQKKGSIDILGFSAQDWEETFKNLDTTKDKVKAIGMVFTAMSNAASMFSEAQRNLGERDLQRFEKQQSAKKKALLKNLNLGLINQEEYQKSIQNLDTETANKKAEIEYKQAKADKIARMFAVVGNTAMGITAALATVPPNPVLAAIVGAIGAIQLGVIAAQPLPEKQSYATGGFTGSGFGSADSTGLKPAGIVHQNEWVAPPWMLQQPRTAKVIDYLESIRQGKTTPMAEGGYSDSNFVNKSQDISTNADTSNADYVQFISALMQVKDLLQKLYDEGITAEMTDSEQNGKLFKKAIKKFETIENRASGK